MADKLKIKGGKRLKGTVTVAGAKNSALILIAASLLTDENIQLDNIPHLRDVATMLNLLAGLGTEITLLNHNRLELNCKNVKPREVPYDLVKAMRASVVVLGPLLARFGKAKVALPGGCAIGSRPIDMHIDALKAMGAEFLIEEGYIIGRRPRGGLRGAEIHFREVTVTGTENILMAATLAKGVTTIHNAACEPEVVDLANLLIKMGAKIEGAGTEIIRVEGVKKLHAAEHRVISDRIEAGTYLIAACATRGKIKVKGAVEEHLKALLEKLKECGAKITVRADEIDIEMKHRPKAVDIETAPFPGFATDLQAQMMALNCIAEGTSHIEETIFENRMMHVGELRRFGADIHIKNYVAIIHGAQKLSGAPVQASDLRASAALVTAALAAKGITIVEDVHHMDRGYEYIEEKLRALGAKIERIST